MENCKESIFFVRLAVTRQHECKISRYKSNKFQNSTINRFLIAHIHIRPNRSKMEKKEENQVDDDALYYLINNILPSF